MRQNWKSNRVKSEKVQTVSEQAEITIMKFKRKKQRPEFTLTKDLLCRYSMEQAWLDSDTFEKKARYFNMCSWSQRYNGVIRLN